MAVMINAAMPVMGKSQLLRPKNLCGLANAEIIEVQLGHQGVRVQLLGCTLLLLVFVGTLQDRAFGEGQIGKVSCTEFKRPAIGAQIDLGDSLILRVTG